jgi:acetylornithine deacetylase/succinyl-diaminopimelate desuccinylase-like protein
MNAVEERILAYMQKQRDALFELLSALVQIDSQNFVQTGREQEVQEKILQHCQALGLPAQLYVPDRVPGLTAHPGYLPGRGTDRRPNVTAVLHGTAPKRRIMLAAHADTMPVGDERLWTVPPLGGVRKNGRIYGRGAGDDKAGIAAALFTLQCLQETGVQLSDDVLFTSYADEEYGGGNGALAACLKYPSQVYVNLDGMGMAVNPWGVGGCVVEIELWTNAPVSSAWPAYEGVQVFMENLKTFSSSRYGEMARSSVYNGTEEYRDTMRIGSIAVGDNCSDLGRAKVSFVFYTLSSRQVIQQELVQLRAQVADDLKKLQMSIGEFRATSRFFQPVLPATPGTETQRLASALEEVRGKPTVLRGFCLSDLSIFGQYGGGEAFNFGAGQSFAQEGGFHQPDEYVDCQELLDEAKTLALYLIRAAT